MRLWRRVYKERRRVMLPLVVLLAVDAAMLTLAVLPLAQSVSRLEADAQTAETNLLQARLLERQAKDALASRGRADQELSRFYVDILPGNPTAARKMISFVERTAGETGLVFRRSNQPESAELEDSQLARMSVKITLLGGYTSIRQFLHAIEIAPEFVVIEQVGLSEAADLRSAESGQLEVTLDVATYYLVSPPATR
jgi:Tfp pilus assembly protein PilO